MKKPWSPPTRMKPPGSAHGIWPKWTPLAVIPCFELALLLLILCFAAGLWSGVAVVFMGKDERTTALYDLVGLDKEHLKTNIGGDAGVDPLIKAPRLPTSTHTNKFSTDPSTELLMAWAEAKCGAVINTGVTIAPFPTLSSSQETSKVHRGLNFYFTWIEWLWSTGKYKTTSRQLRLASTQPFYTELTHPASGLGRSSPDTSFTYGGFSVGRGRGPFSTIIRILNMERWWDVGLIKAMLWIFNPFYWGQMEDGQGESTDFIMSGGGRGIWYDPSRDNSPSHTGSFPVVSVPQGCQMTGAGAIETITDIAARELESNDKLKIPLIMSYQPPYVSNPGSKFAKLVTPHQAVDHNPSRMQVSQNVGYMASQLDDSMLLAVWLARERWLGPESEWAPYIRTLPGVTEEWTEPEWSNVIGRVEEMMVKEGNVKKEDVNGTPLDPKFMHRYYATPPPATCGWMVEGWGRGRVTNSLESIGVNVEGWDEELEGVSNYVDLIATSLSSDYGWLITAPLGTGKGAEPSGGLANPLNVKASAWNDKGQRRKGVSVRDMVMWGMCIVGNRGIYGEGKGEVAKLKGGKRGGKDDRPLLSMGQSTYKTFRSYFAEEIERRTGVAGVGTTGGTRMVPLVDFANHDVRMRAYFESGGKKGGVEVSKKKREKGKRGMVLKKIFDIREEEGEAGGGEETYFEGSKVTVPEHKPPRGAEEYEKGTFVVFSDKKGKHEVLVNYSADGYSPLDWFLNFGFIPSERSRPWTREPECFKSPPNEDDQNNNPGVHKQNKEGWGDLNEFTEQQERGKDWRMEREGK